MHQNNIPLSLYVHIPWCLEKCPYCDFNSHSIKGPIPEKSYINRLIDDFQQDITFFNETRPIKTIFIGGGTPSLFKGESIAYLLEKIDKLMPFQKDIEITLEANPGTVDIENFRTYLSSGVNRLSIGIQSFQPLQLSQLGRIHNAQQADYAVKYAQDVGFKKINIDIMFGLPLQTKKQALDDIKKATALNTTHLSYYQLTLEPGTLFFKHPPKTPSDNHIDKRHQQACDLLETVGFIPYEISAWAKQNNYCQHNLNYWQYGDYIGIGAGAHGKITHHHLNSPIITRTTKPKSPNLYLSSDISKLCTQRIVNDKEKAFEFMLNSLRLHEGFDIEWVNDRGLFNLANIDKKIDLLVTKKLITVSKDCIKPTALGQRFLNDILEVFL